MITHENITKLIQEEFLDYLADYKDGAYSDYANSIAFFNENAVNDDSNIRVIVSFMSSDPQVEMADFPIRISVDCIERDAVKCIDIFNSFAMAYTGHESVVADDNDKEYSITSYFRTTDTISNNTSVGVKKYKRFNLQCRFNATPISYAKLEDVKLYVEIDGVMKEFTRIISIGRTFAHQKDSIPSASTGITKNYNNNINQTISVDFIVDLNDAVHKELINNVGTNKTYSIKYAVGTSADDDYKLTPITQDMTVINYNDSVDYTSILKAHIEFVKR